MGTTHIIDGKQTAADFRKNLAEEIKRAGISPGLAVILVGDNPASLIYAKNKQKAAQEVGVTVEVHHLAALSSERMVMDLIDALNKRPDIHGILLQLPVPMHLNPQNLIERIDPVKDVDGLHPVNVGKMTSGLPAMIPCTPLGCMYLIKQVVPSLVGKQAVVVGRSALVGRPLAHLLLQEDCTVTQAHSKTTHLAEVCRQADILVAAAGVPHLIGADAVKKGAVVIDVGINRQENGKITGDVDFDALQDIASFITPVPGGVGPMTIAMLLFNTLKAARNQMKTGLDMMLYGE